MGVSYVEARLLSGENAFEQAARLLLHATQLRGGELYLSRSSGCNYAAELGERHTGWLYLCCQGSPADYAYQATDRCGSGRRFILHCSAAASACAEVRPGAVPIAAKP